VTDGWKTILMRKTVDGQLVPLYTPEQVPWVLATRLFYLALVVGTCLLIRRAWAHRNWVKHPSVEPQKSR